MIGSMTIKKDVLPFPKLMINENVVALFSDAENAVVVSEICDTAVSVGWRLSEGSFAPDCFSDFHGIINLSNK